MYKTEQEQFWSTDFGNEYIKRNTYEDLYPGLLYFWSKIISKTSAVKSCIEFGANIGVNLRAIKTLVPDMEIAAIEINHMACQD